MSILIFEEQPPTDDPERLAEWLARVIIQINGALAEAKNYSPISVMPTQLQEGQVEYFEIAIPGIGTPGPWVYRNLTWEPLITPAGGYDDSNVLMDSDALTAVTVSNLLLTQADSYDIDGDTLSPVTSTNLLITEADLTGGGFETELVADDYNLNDPLLSDRSILTYSNFRSIPSSWPSQLEGLYNPGMESRDPIGVIVLTLGRQTDFPGTTTRGCVQTLTVASAQVFGQDYEPASYFRNYDIVNDRMQQNWIPFLSEDASTTVRGGVVLAANAEIAAGQSNPRVVTAESLLLARYLSSVQPGPNVTIDNTDPLNPIVSAAGVTPDGVVEFWGKLINASNSWFIVSTSSNIPTSSNSGGVVSANFNVDVASLQFVTFSYNDVWSDVDADLRIGYTINAAANRLELRFYQGSPRALVSSLSTNGAGREMSFYGRININ